MTTDPATVGGCHAEPSPTALRAEAEALAALDIAEHCARLAEATREARARHPLPWHAARIAALVRIEEPLRERWLRHTRSINASSAKGV
jgi:hypothetical protein